MRNTRNEMIRFAIWMRNGVSFCITWFLLLILAYDYYFHIPNIAIVDLIKGVLLIIGGVLIFNVCFTRFMMKKVNFTARLTCFMGAISLYECLGFYWLGFFQGKGSAVQWLIFITIIFMLYAICILLYRRYSKKQGEIYTEKLIQYQRERRSEHEK